MAIRGWVYIVSNQAMPGLLKIGFSTKDPALRALDLNNTGSPHPYVVVYDALVHEPRDIEQRVHAALKAQCVGKEWFNCSREVAIRAIRRIADGSIITETSFSFPDAGRTQASDAAWTLNPSTGVLTHQASGRQFKSSEYYEEGGGYVIKTWLIKDWKISWVQWGDVDIIE